MIILTIRTDKPEAEIGLYDNNQQLVYETWQAHRQLAETLHKKISTLMTVQGSTLYSLEGVVVFRGPGSFTGLRIGLSVGNALAYALGCPIVGVYHDDWISEGINRLVSGATDQIVLPEYGSPANITKPRK